MAAFKNYSSLEFCHSQNMSRKKKENIRIRLLRRKREKKIVIRRTGWNLGGYTYAINRVAEDRLRHQSISRYVQTIIFLDQIMAILARPFAIHFPSNVAGQ